MLAFATAGLLPRRGQLAHIRTFPLRHPTLIRCSASKSLRASTFDESLSSNSSNSTESIVIANPPIPKKTTVKRKTPSRAHVRLLFLAIFAMNVLRSASVFALTNPLASLATLSESSFVSGLTSSFILVLASEIGDKTFFISALLSMKYSRVLVLIGTMLALASMTVISVGIGQVFHALPASLNSSIPFDDYAAVALLLWFGFQNIRDGLTMTGDDDEELQDAKDVVAGKAPSSSSGARVVAETTSLIFLAEWGDKSMLATVALAAAKSPLGVVLGGISGHFIASIIAVVGGSVLGRFISEKNARLIGGVLFLIFAGLTVFGIY